MLPHQSDLFNLPSCDTTTTITKEDDSNLPGTNQTLESTIDPPLIEDSMRTLLPTMNGQHPDLNCITSDTLRCLIDGEFTSITKYFIVDCRFPYEYTGGHVNSPNTVNLHTTKQIDDFFFVKTYV